MTTYYPEIDITTSTIDQDGQELLITTYISYVRHQRDGIWRKTQVRLDAMTPKGDYPYKEQNIQADLRRFAQEAYLVPISEDFRHAVVDELRISELERLAVYFKPFGS